MKKKELMILVPPEMTPDLMETARQDTPVKSEHWASDKKYKYGRYFLAKKEKGYLIVSVFLAQYVRAGAKYPTYVVYFDKKADDFITFETDSGKWRESMLSNLDWPRYIYASGIYMSQQDENLI